MSRKVLLVVVGLAVMVCLAQSKKVNLEDDDVIEMDEIDIQ